MKRIVILIVLSALATQLCVAQGNYVYTPPAELADGWKTNDLRSMAADTARLYSLFNQLTEQEHQLHSLLLIKDNQLVMEKYFHGHDAAKRHDLRSVSKSIKSILLGIALDKGIIDDIDDPISKYLKSHRPEKNLDPRKNDITIRHLITMSAGWDCDDWNKKSKGQEDRVFKKGDRIQTTLDLPMINDPGAVSTYCTMGVVLTAEIIEQAAGIPLDQFAEQYLFAPLGIKNKQWGHTSDKEVRPAERRLYMTPRELAKIGQLILNEGAWDGKQIVSSEWINTATTPKTTITGIDYGYLWWNIPFPTPNGPLIAKTATGNGGQYIMVFPELNLVAVFTGGAYNSPDAQAAFPIVKDVVLPTFGGAPTKSN